MKNIVKLKESDLTKIVEKIIKEQNSGYKGGFSFSNFIDNDLIQDVIDRMNNLYCEGCGDEYKEALKLFNKNWEIDKKRTRRI
jgi:hypothetical protein